MKHWKMICMAVLLILTMIAILWATDKRDHEMIEMYDKCAQHATSVQEIQICMEGNSK